MLATADHADDPASLPNIVRQIDAVRARLERLDREAKLLARVLRLLNVCKLRAEEWAREERGA